MTESYFEFWPPRVPRSLPLPQTSVYHNLEVSASRYPEKTAIIYYGTEIPYKRLLDEVNALAGYLQRELGVEKGDRVLLYMQNSPQFVMAFYAVLRLGAVVVPVNPMLVTNELTHYVEDSEARVAIVGQELYPKVSPLLAESGSERVIVAAYSDYLEKETDLAVPDVVTAPREEVTDEGVTSWGEALKSGHEPGPVVVGAEDMALLPYTSGTTGRPKGCVHTHRTLQATLVGVGVWNTTTPAAVMLCVLPLFHVTGMQHSMNAPIYSGGTFVILTRWDRELAAELIQRHGITHWTNISTMVVDFLANPKIGGYDLSSLVIVGGGGAPLPAAVGEKLNDLTGLRYQEGYGLSETISQTHVNPPDRPKLQCLGVPHFDVDARVVNPATLEELGPNEEGEIVVSGPQVMRGYWRRPDADEEAFFERDGKRFFRTGDIAVYDDEGYFFMVDRLKRMINASGYKVWPSEVESILYKHPAIQEACIIGVPDEQRGETAKAVVVLREGESVSAEEIVEWSKGQMAAYKYPRNVEFVEALPKSGSGKILWRELQEKEQQKMAEAK
ncbi:MAG TPA: long-chain fatty acid--CoA ligase [Rubrobacteraceae bacterium]|nr:long-chain fatty acid--CoA ligase [Rubrobacteraceae bacterium]